MNSTEYALGDTVYMFHTRGNPAEECRVEKITATQITVKVLKTEYLKRFMLSNGNEVGKGDSWSYWFITTKDEGAKR